MSAITCPHCRSTNPDPGQFCVVCGKAMPRPSDKPRVFERHELPQTPLGRQLQLDALHPQTRGGRPILLVFSAIPVALGLLVMLGSLLIENDILQREALAGGSVFIVIGLLTLGLWFWSGKRPFPATLVGLILYATGVVALFAELFGENAWGVVFVLLVCAAAAGLLVGPTIKGLRYRTLLRAVEELGAAR